MHPFVTAEIRLDAIRGNLRTLRRQVSAATPLCAAVKADAYGHGIDVVLPALAAEGVESLAVAHLEEALQLRSLGWTRPILCLGAPLCGSNEADCRLRAREAIAADIQCNVGSLDEARRLSDEAARMDRPARVEIKIDSGMGRMGTLPPNAAELLTEISACPHVIIEGVYTHFATADEPDPAFARQQLACFLELMRTLQARGAPVPRFHAANSAAIFRLPESHLDMVRPGLAVYGYWGGAPDDRPKELQPAMRLVSRLVAVRRLLAGHSVGYGRTFHTSRDSIIGVVPVGYADGYRRALGNNAVVTVEARRGQPRILTPVIGRVSMDQLSVDLTEVRDARVGDPVVLIDNDPAASNSVESLARQLGTIPYEIICALGQRIRRIAK